MLRRTFNLVLTTFKGMFILILGYVVPFVAIIIVARTICLTIYTFCLAYIILMFIIIIFSLGNHIKKKEVI